MMFDKLNKKLGTKFEIDEANQIIDTETGELLSSDHALALIKEKEKEIAKREDDKEFFDKIDKDFEWLLEIGKRAAYANIQLAEQGGNSKDFEAISKIIQSVANALSARTEAQEKRRALEIAENQEKEEQSKDTNIFVFTGSFSDLQKEAKKELNSFSHEDVIDSTVVENE